MAHRSDFILPGALTRKYAAIAASSSGDNTIIAAVAGNRILVFNVGIIAAAAVTIRFEDGAGGTALTGQMEIIANGGFTWGFSEVGWFQTSVNTLLNLELSGAISVAGALAYVEIPN